VNATARRQPYERNHHKIISDAAFLRMLGEAAQCLIAGSTRDELLQTI
jgi:hypothetical protein